MAINLGSGVQANPAKLDSCNAITLTTTQATDYYSATATGPVRGRLFLTEFPSAPYPVSGGSAVDAVAANGVSGVNQSGIVSYWAAVDSINKVFLISGPLSSSYAMALGQSITLSPFTITIPTSGAASTTPVSVVLQPAAINKVSGDQLGCTVSQAMVAPLVVQALDANSNPVPGATVTWSASAGSLSASTSTTGADGKAQVTWTAPSTPQPSTITATVGSLSAQFSEQSHMALYGTHSPYPAALKALDSSKDPLANGFIPDTGETWSLVANMSDEFTGSAIDTTKWSLRLPGGWDHYNDELERYVDSAVTVSNGTCKLTAVSRTGTVGHAASPSGFQYTLYDSGVITTKNTVTGDYYSECRLRLPTGQGVWAAYWGLPTTNYQGETDFMEYVYNNGSERQNMIHNNNLCDGHGNQPYWCDAYYNSQYGVWTAPPTLSATYMVDDWRVLACHKRADRTTIYLDGQPISQRKIQPYNLAQQIIHNLAMGGGWPTTNSSGAAWTQPVSLGPEVFEIDYTRVYTPS